MRRVTPLLIITFSFLTINVLAQDETISSDANKTIQAQESQPTQVLKTSKKGEDKPISSDASKATDTQGSQSTQALKTGKNGEDGIIQLDAITVTGTRAQETQLSQALKIDKKGEEEVKIDQPIFQKDLLNSLSGVLVTQTTSVIGHMLSVRTPISTSPYFLYLQDNIPVQSSGFFNHNALAYTNFETAASTEVLKGAGTALYGSDAVAATVNVQSKTPSKLRETTVSTKGGSDGYYHAYVQTSDSINRKSSYRIGIGRTTNEGWRDHTQYSRHETMARYDYIINDNNTLEASFSANETDADQAGNLIGLHELKHNHESIGDVDDKKDIIKLKRKFDFARLSLKWDNYSFENMEISTIGYLRQNRNRYIATWENSLPGNDSRSKSFGFMHKTTREIGPVKVIVGLDFERTFDEEHFTQLFDFVPTGFGTPIAQGSIFDYDVKYHAISPYIQTTWNINSKLIAKAGLRYDYNQFDYSNNTEDGQYGTSKWFRPSDGRNSFEHYSPKLSLSYYPQETMELYVRYANGFRIPSATRLYSQQRTTGATTFKLNEEITNTYEIGLKKVFSKFSADLVLYHMDIRETITERTDAVTGDRFYENGGTSFHNGLELSFQQNFLDFFSTKFSYSYSKIKFHNDRVFDYNNMSLVPRHKGNVRLFLTPNEKLTFMAEGEFVSSYWMDNENENKYSGYTIGNLKADYKLNSSLRLFMKLNNLANERYAEKAEFTFGKEKYTPGAPRQLFAGIDFTF